jgi:membrane protein
MKAILDALNVVYEEKEKRGFIKLNLVTLCFTLAAIATLLLALGAVVVMPIALNFLGLHEVTDLLLRAVRWPILLALIIVGLAVLYRFGPSRREPGWQWISVGSVVAALAWLAASVLLSWYLVGALRQLRCHLGLARGRHRVNDVDVDFLHRHFVRS